VNNKFFIKNKENLHAYNLKGGLRQEPRSPLLKNTTVHITQTTTRVGPIYTLHSQN